MKVISAADVPAVPWRNGGGLTRELLAWPDPADWRLRVSVADIASDGPFSAFPGVTRVFAVLEGPGVALTWPGRRVEQRTTDMPLTFDGADPPQGQLLDGPVRDLNVMCRGGSVSVLPAANPWRPAYGARAGLFARVPGRWQCGPQSVPVPARTLLWDDAASGSEWRFVADTDDTTNPAGWWILHEDTHA
ncbi:HutD/Ves family protein [Hydrogenophaga aquatica]